ncbi:oxidoreductase [Nocardioides psychrotolerans]|uniref:Glycine/D-amino acid oxidase n=1 Tax=Nocardioides psychrotolerans TaxID=1005945 RepID=A0A1I3PBI3_9ACTN|nr:FAD-dependent oxidoreductase [Nocardioides psychrotolerans]GEP39634.1 oxidoreductase [Nocardioides psychrotolerans]SFJ18700.1 Glycine/D-amino acid oxidase [Nocardioides psychrotolerans]
MSDLLSDARPLPVWWEGRDTGPVSEPLPGERTADLVVVGAGLTGLWAAIHALEEDPGRDVVVLEGSHVGSGASGRNGGFLAESLTHGLAHGLATWPSELSELLRLGRANVAEIDDFVDREKIDADLRLCGKTAIATRPHEVAALRAAHERNLRHGEASTYLSAEELRADVHSPSYLAGVRTTGGGLVDPWGLTTGLRDVAMRKGAVLHEESPVTALERDGDRIAVHTPHGVVRARQVVLATNAFPPLLRRIRAYVLPVWDHVLATAPLTTDQLDAIGWSQGQGLTDAGNQFHYYRRTADDRILWGGYDAVYYYGNGTQARREQREASHRLLAEQFYATFPQLADVRMTHRWAGIIDTTSRFTPVFGTAYAGRVAYAVGYTGLGVASSRFGARVALDLLAGRETERTAVSLVSRRPVPFPPEPFRWTAVQAARVALAREDRSGHRGALLRTMDRFGVGFNS